MLAFSLPDSGVRIYEINIAKGVSSWLSKQIFFMVSLPIGNTLCRPFVLGDFTYIATMYPFQEQ
jgi:hypothetical protein